MGIIDKIIRCMSERVLFITLEAIVVTKSGHDYPLHAHDWEYRQGIIDAIRNYSPKKVFIISNQDGIQLGYTKDWDVNRKAELTCRMLREFTQMVDYIYCLSLDPLNPMRMPNTGMIDYFKHRHVGESFDETKIFMVGHDDITRTCARNVGCEYIDVNDFVETYQNVE